MKRPVNDRRPSGLARGIAAGAALGWAVARAARAAHIRHATVLYDGDCPLCRASVARLRAWDTAGRLDYLDARNTAALAVRFPHLPPDPELREMRLVLDGGHVVGGFGAIRALAALLPRFRPLTPLLYLPGIAPLGSALYRIVAAHRPREACTDQACSLSRGTR